MGLIMKLKDALLRQKELREKLVQLNREYYKPCDSLKVKVELNEFGSKRRSSEHLYYFGLHRDISIVIQQANLNTDIDIDERVFIDYSPDKE